MALVYLVLQSFEILHGIRFLSNIILSSSIFLVFWSGLNIQDDVIAIICRIFPRQLLNRLSQRIPCLRYISAPFSQFVLRSIQYVFSNIAGRRVNYTEKVCLKSVDDLTSARAGNAIVNNTILGKFGVISAWLLYHLQGFVIYNHNDYRIIDGSIM